MKKLLLASAATLLLTSAAGAANFECGAPTLFLGARDNDPVVRVEVSYTPAEHAWRVFHTLSSGRIAARAEQYAITDWTNGEWKWAGSLNRNRNLFMIGVLHPNGYYEEWLYDRSQGNRLDMHMGVQCRLIAQEPPMAIEPGPVWRTPVLPLPVPVPAAPSAPSQQTVGPMQNNGPIIVPPSSNSTTIIINPAAPAASPKEGS